MTTVTIRYFDGCPHWQVAESRVRAALDVGGIEADLVFEEVSTQEDAERLRFVGSPTILIDGVDPFPGEGADVGLTCRVYPTEEGLQGSPTVQELVEALRA